MSRIERPGPSAGPSPVGLLLAAVDWLRPVGPSTGRAAFQSRFLTGGCALGALVALAALWMTLQQGEMAAAVIVTGFLASLLLQLGALRLGAPVPILAWTVSVTLAVYLVAMSLVTRGLQPEQLFWLTIIPLATLVLNGPRADDVESQATIWPTVVAMLVALVAAVLVVAAQEAGINLGQPPDPVLPWFHALNYALYLLSTFGLLYLYGLAARQAQAELSRLRKLLSVCAWCRKIRDQDEWVSLEHYMVLRTRTDLSHGICPSCLNRHYPEDDPAA